MACPPAIIRRGGTYCKLLCNANAILIARRETTARDAIVSSRVGASFRSRHAVVHGYSRGSRSDPGRHRRGAQRRRRDPEEVRGVEYVKYWFNENRGKVFCLVHAPNSDAANRVHGEAHGLVAEKIIEVEPELVEAFLGDGRVNPAGAVVVPGGSDDDRDPGIRTVLFTDIVGSTTLDASPSGTRRPWPSFASMTASSGTP